MSTSLAILKNANLSPSLHDRIEWLGSLISELRKPSLEAQLETVLRELDEDAALKATVAAALRALVTGIDWSDFFCECRFNQNLGFWSETAARAFHRVIPISSSTNNVHEVLYRVFPKKSDALGIEHLSRKSATGIVQLLEYGEPSPGQALAEVKRGIADALLVLGSRLSTFGVSREIRRRLPQYPPSQSPFVALQRSLTGISQRLIQKAPIDEEALALFEAAEADLDVAFSLMQSLHAQLEKYGVSVALVYSMEGQLRNLHRVDNLLRLSLESLPAISSRLALGLFAEGILDSQSRRSLTELFRTNLHLLSRKIVEHTGAMGEHYITKDRREYFQMLRRALGGGVLTVGTTFLKTIVTHSHLARFVEGTMVSLNYTASFLAIQFCGFTLATKQPSMTASALAGKLKDLDYRLNVDEFLDEVVAFSRSQFIAIVGNVGAAIPAALLFSLIYRYFAHHAPFDHHYAHHTIEGLNPFGSLTIFYAAFTGLILWVSSLCAGAAENWAVYRNLFHSIETYAPLKRLFGAAFAKKASHWFHHNINGLAANTSLGFFIGLTHVFGKSFFIPLDVRHVTLSTCALVFSVCSLEHVDSHHLVRAIAGIFFIGTLNVWTTFFLSLGVAARARRVRRGWLFYLVRQITLRFLRNPLPFFIAPK